MKNWHLPSLLHEILALFGCLEHRNPVNQHLIRKIKDRLNFFFHKYCKISNPFSIGSQTGQSVFYSFSGGFQVFFLPFLGKILYRSGKEVLPPVLTSNSEPPPVFDGTTRYGLIQFTCLQIHSLYYDKIAEFLYPFTNAFPPIPKWVKINQQFILHCCMLHSLCFRLYISYTCPYAQRVWITRNCKVIFTTFHGLSLVCLVCI